MCPGGCGILLFSVEGKNALFICFESLKEKMGRPHGGQKRCSCEEYQGPPCTPSRTSKPCSSGGLGERRVPRNEKFEVTHLPYASIQYFSELKKLNNFQGNITTGRAFLEHPRVILHVKRYLASLEEGRGADGGGGVGGENQGGSLCLDCMESLREYQQADTTEHRQELWTAIQRRANRFPPYALQAVATPSDFHLAILRMIVDYLTLTEVYPITFLSVFRRCVPVSMGF